MISRFIFVLLVVFTLSAGALAQVPLNPTAVNVSALPAASASTGKVYVVKDGAFAGDCTIGGAGAVTWCRSNGSAWSPIGDGTSVGGTGEVTSFNGRDGAVLPVPGDYTKSDVGLSNVDNTSDVNKPVSTAQAAADALALAKASNLSDLANAGTARSNLGGTTVGSNLFTATNPSAISFPKIAADNSVSFRTPAQVLSDIGAQASLGFTPLNAALADGKIYVGNGAGVGTAVTPSGDVTISNTGVTAIGALKVTNAMLAGSIDATKIADGSVTSAEFQFVNSLSSNAQTQIDSKVPNTRTITEGAGLAGNTYDLSANRTLALGTPSTLTVATSNSASGTTHAHAVTSSSNPGAAASLLATDPSGYLTTVRHTVSDYLFVNAATANLFLKDTNTGFQSALTTVVQLQANNRLQSSGYASQTTGWAADGATGAGDFRYLYTDELHAKAFIADIEQALAGGQIITKSVAKVAADFAIPAAGASNTLNVEEFAGSTAHVFVNEDLVQLRQITRAADTSLTIASAYGTMTYISRTAASGTTPAFQSYTFSRPASNGGSATGTISAGTLAIDYGSSTNKFGYWEVNAVDGANAANSPYAQIVTASGTGGPAVQANRTIRTRLGNIKGISGATEYGLYAGNAVDGVTLATTHRYLRLTDTNFELNNLDLNIYNGGNRVIALDYATPYFSLGPTAPTSYLGSTGYWVGNSSGTYKSHLGSVSAGVLTAGYSWDGTTFTVKGGITTTSGFIGGFEIGPDYILDTPGNSFGLASTVSGVDDVRIWAGSTFANRYTAPFRVTEAGAVTATSGAIGAWSITSTDIRNSGATVMLRGAGNLAFGATPPTSASAGTGLFLDSTGMYGLLSNVVQAKFDAATGTFITGDGEVSMSVNGIRINAGTSKNGNSLAFVSASTTVAKMDVLSTGTAKVLRLEAFGLASTDTVNAILRAQNILGGSYISSLVLESDGTAAKSYGTFSVGTGIVINSASSSLVPNAMLDVRGTAAITDNLFLSSGKKIDFAAGDVTITHASNALAFAGATSGYTFMDGFVGIGPIAPGIALSVSNAGSASAITSVGRFENSTTASNVNGQGVALEFVLPTDSGTRTIVGQIASVWTDITNANRAADMVFSTKIAGGANTERMRIFSTGGVNFGSPTGGDKGAGSTNAVTVWRNGTSLDYVFEKGYKLLSIEDMSAYFRKNNHLPTIETRKVHDKGSTNEGALVDALWETVEVQALYITELNERLKKVEKKPH